MCVESVPRLSVVVDMCTVIKMHYSAILALTSYLLCTSSDPALCSEDNTLRH